MTENFTETVTQKMIDEVLDEQNRQLTEKDRVLPAWYNTAVNNLEYPIAKEDGHFVLMVAHDYFPNEAAKADRTYKLETPLIKKPVKIFIAIYFLRNGNFVGVKTFLVSTCKKFEHYHSGYQNDFDCIGNMRKPGNIKELFTNESEGTENSRFIESLKKGLDVIRLDSTTQNDPVNNDVDFTLPHCETIVLNENKSTRIFSA